MTVQLHCRTVDLTGVRAGLTDALETAGLRVCPWLADQWNPPCALVGAFSIEWTNSSYEGLTTATCSVRLVVPTLALRPAQQELDTILMQYATALQDAPTLNGAVMRVLPVRAEPLATAKGNQDLASYDCETVCII